MRASMDPGKFTFQKEEQTSSAFGELAVDQKGKADCLASHQENPAE